MVGGKVGRRARRASDTAVPRCRLATASVPLIVSVLAVQQGQLDAVTRRISKQLLAVSVVCGEWRSAAFRSAWFTWIESHERRSRVFGALSSLRHRNARLAFNRLRSATALRPTLKATKTFLSRTTERRC